MDSLILKYDKIIQFSGNRSGFRILSGFSRIFLKFSEFKNLYHSLRELNLEYDMIFFSESSGFSRILKHQI